MVEKANNNHNELLDKDLETIGPEMWFVQTYTCPKR